MLQILNGDALAEALPSNILGRIAIVRECLIEGPIEAESIQELWIARSKYLSERYPEAGQDDYFTKVVPEFGRILTASTSTEVYCWFERDLFCQVNLWFVMSLLKNHTGDIFLVLPNETTDLEKGFAGMNERELVRAFRNARLLKSNGRHVLSHLWTMYQDQNINEAITLATQVEPELPFLLPAVQAWKDAIPHGDNLGKPKTALKSIIAELQTDDFARIYHTFHSRYPIYGFGDIQVQRMWEEIKAEEINN